MSTPEAPSVYEVDELSEILASDSDDTGDGDWYAIHTDPWPCPTCGVEFSYVTACHHVVVTNERDDLIDHAVSCTRAGRNPRIVRYQDSLPTITLWQWRALGRPVHGVKKR
ncbi:MAG: hypothetical protein ACXVY5_02280 [Gaiellales bacterium]